MPDFSDKDLQELVEEATIDCTDEQEQLGGFAVMLEDELKVPFQTTVLGVEVTVEQVRQTDTDIVADCVRDGYRQPIAVLDLPLPDPPPEGARWIAAYRRWARYQ